ncbi:hypothetical protein IAQ61_003027 [Plenodomus lingam]|uniref:uncharacterized protein n=1 Tax=Leptosphaeria maculans TaxID=5022 RepID=UPI00332DFC92|nr:hypothetical protein IAQ61_003027 [Plenodomus lingam]
MSGVEVVAAVAAVISAFHGGAELLSLVKKKRRARKVRDQERQEFEESQLENSLVTAEQKIGLRYAQDQRELGDHMRIGDVVARDRLVYIALIMQAEIIKSLQLAATHDNAILNLRILHQTSIANRKETFVTLDELKQRILITRPLARQIGGSYDGITNCNLSLQTIQPNNLIPTTAIPDEYIPRAITMPSRSDSRQQKHGLSEYLHGNRNRDTHTLAPAQPQSSAHAANINFSAALEELVRSRGSEDRTDIMRDIDHIIGSYKGLDMNSDPSASWSRNQYNNEYLERRDTLMILHDSDLCRPDLNQGNVSGTKALQSFGDYQIGNRQAFPYAQNIFDARYGQQIFDQHYNNPQHAGRVPTTSQQSHLQQSRGSASSAASSANSDPVLRHNSGSSQGSSMHPVSITFKASPPADQVCFPPSSLSPSEPFEQTTEGLHDPYSSSPLYAPSEDLTPPIVPVLPWHASDQPTAVFQTPPSNDSPSDPVSISQGDAMLPVHKPWPGSQRDVSPFSHDGPSPQYRNIIHEQGSNEQTVRSQYEIPQATHEGSDVHSGRRGQSITLSGFEAVEAATSALSGRAVIDDIRHLSTALSIASTNSSRSGSIGILPGARIRSSIRTDTIQSPPTGKEHMMNGRPCKDNNYWGFCKGAWAIRENVSKGLSIRTLPSGYYNSKQMWQCTACNFQGDIFSVPHPVKKNKSIEIVDPRIHLSMAGIRYRWIFLAKSHVKKKPPAAVDTISNSKTGTSDCNYGCVICSAEGNVTGVYGGAETLMNHIALTHVADMTEKTRRKVNCVLGRVAGVGEEWDINVPIFEDVEELVI